jgi:dihydroorotase
MPNLSPVPDSMPNIRAQLEIIEKDAAITVLPYAAITVGEKGEELSEMQALAPYAVAFSDDGRGVQSEDMMRSAMLEAKKLGKIIVAHCEENSLLNGGYIHDGIYAKQHNHKGICSKSEWLPIERDIKLSEETGCPYHVCHISAKESVELIRQAKKRGVNITCETAPHYLTLDENNLQEDGRFKMNPPLRSREDREALIEGLLDGTIDMIATDHAPHSKEEKSKGLAGSAFGITGIEIAFPVLYTKLVKTGIVPLEKIIECLTVNPLNRFSVSSENEYCIWDLNQSFKVNPDEFISKGKSTPFEGETLFGRCIFNTATR